MTSINFDITVTRCSNPLRCGWQGAEHNFTRISIKIDSVGAGIKFKRVVRTKSDFLILVWSKIIITKL